VNGIAFVIAYFALFWLLPWTVFACVVIRSVIYAHKQGISLFCSSFQELLSRKAAYRDLVNSDTKAKRLERLGFRWLIITVVLWGVGFALFVPIMIILQETGWVR